MTINQQIIGKSTPEKAAIKADAILKVVPIGKYTDGALTIEIQSIKAMDDGVEILARAWNKKGQLGFVDGTVEIERFRIHNPPIMVEDPNGDVIRISVNRRTGKEETRTLREDPMRALQETLSKIISVTGMDGSKIVEGKVGQTTDTFLPDASPETNSMDANLATTSGGAGASFATIRGQTGVQGTSTSGTSNEVYLQATSTSNQYNELDRSIIFFYTGPTIPSTDTISSATLTLTGKGSKSSALGESVAITGNTQASATTITNGSFDIANFGSSDYANRIIISSGWSTSAGNVFTLNSTGIAAIQKGGTGVTKFAMRLSGDVDNSAPTWTSGGLDDANSCSADTVGTSSDPLLTVVHSAASVVNSNFLAFF